MKADLLRRTVFWGGLPLVALQGLRVRRRALRFPPAAGVDHGSIGDGPVLRLLAFGDSIIAGVGAPTLDVALIGRYAASLAHDAGRCVQWRACGRSGAHAGELRAQMQASAAPVCDVALISIGVNDVTGLRRRARFAADLRAAIALLQQANPEVALVLAGLPPLHAFPLLPQPLRALFGLRARSLDAVLREIAVAHGALHLPMERPPGPGRFADDGFHPNPLGYAEWGAALAEATVMRWPRLASQALLPAGEGLG
jgi:lysophospholipase L1-like esterase